MATVTKPIALDESLNTTEQSSRNIADVLAQEIGNLVTVVSRIAPPTTVSWNQIEQSGTKIAEITINGTKTDVYAPQGGGGFSALIIVTDALAGVTITATKGGVTKTGTSIGNNQYEISVDSSGTWTISDGTNTATVTVTAQTTYYLTLGVPDGSTVTPTDDIQTLLNCANIWDKSYTTLTELLADSTSLQAVISSNNAIDYLVRSTSFAKANALVPTMTSNNTPSGVCSSSGANASYPEWQAFDGDNTTFFVSSAKTVGTYLQYDFGANNGKKLVSVRIANRNRNGITLKASNDGFASDEHVILSEQVIGNGETSTFTLSNVDEYRYVRAVLTSNPDNNTLSFNEIQFYGEDGFTDNSTAMSYIGLNNYASNTLLGDATWASAICNSTYFESVLNVKVPTLSSDNGKLISNQTMDNMWKAFDKDNSTYATGVAPCLLAYNFDSQITFCKAIVRTWYNSTSPAMMMMKNYKIQGSNDNNTYTDITTGSFTNTSSSPVENTHIFYTKYQYMGVYAIDSNRSNNRVDYTELQFYGRADV